jgi:ribosomal protein S27AE
VIGATGEGAEEGEVWFSPGKRPGYLLRGGEERAFDDCRAHIGNVYFIPDGDTSGFGAFCPGCGAPLADDVVVEAVVDFNEADAEDDRRKCPKCGVPIDVSKLKCKAETALAPAFLCFVKAASAMPNPELMKALEEATGCPWKSLTERIE